MRKKIWTGILIGLVTITLSVGWGYLTEIVFIGRNAQTTWGIIGGAVLGFIGVMLWALVNDM